MNTFSAQASPIGTVLTSRVDVMNPIPSEFLRVGTFWRFFQLESFAFNCESNDLNPLWVNFIQWLEVFGVQWLEDVCFMNRSESPASLLQVRSPQALSFQLATTVPQHTARPKFRTTISTFFGWGPDPASHNSLSAIGAIRWNEPLNHRWAALWWSVLSWYLFGCQGRASWISRSGTRFQCWHKLCQHWNRVPLPDNGLGLATSKSDSPLPSDLNFAVFLSLGRPWWCHSWPETLLLWWVLPGSAQRHGLHRATMVTKTAGGSQAQSAIISRQDYWSAFAPITMSHFLRKASRLYVCGLNSESQQLMSILVTTTTCLPIAREIPVTWIFHCWKRTCVLRKTRWSTAKTTTMFVPNG